MMSEPLIPTGYPKGWTDQPDEVMRLPIIFKVHADGRLIEIRAHELRPSCYLTVGNLFGSSTLRAESLFAAMRAAEMVISLKENKTLGKVPAGCTLLHAGKEDADG